jgi:hypothetical protein
MKAVDLVPSFHLRSSVAEASACSSRPPEASERLIAFCCTPKNSRRYDKLCCPLKWVVTHSNIFALVLPSTTAHSAPPALKKKSSPPSSWKKRAHLPQPLSVGQFSAS